MSHAWEPSERYIARSRLRAFAEKQGLRDFGALLRWSVEHPDAFWRAAEADLGVGWSQRYERVMDTSAGAPWTTWWSGGRMNYVATALGHDPAHVAVIAEGEEGTVRTLTFDQLERDVARFSSGLRALGVRKGDRVGIFMPLTVECAVAVLAVGAIGAVYIPIFSGYGAEAIAGRLRDCDASVLITADGFHRRGQVVPMKETADAAVALAPSVGKVVVYSRLGREAPRGPKDVAWDDVVARGNDRLALEDTSAEDPFMVIYTSGTTGRPKGAVHVHGGFPIKAAQDLAHTFDLTDRDALFWFTDLGWMMGPWAIAGSLLLGGRLVIYEGAPDFPGPDRIWSIVARHRVTHLGLSPTVIRALMAHGEAPVHGHDRSSLRVLGSTGEPWNPEPWWWFFREVGEVRCPIVNYSGGTEVSGGIVGGNVVGPIKPASFSGPCIGTAADVVDETGAPVRGAVGELVIRTPLPGMTRGFWNDRSRYEEAYWSRWPGTWAHGDWASIEADGFWYIHGRSDDTLKIAGKRVGPAEVESAAVSHRSVLEAAAIGVPHDIKGEAIVVVCVLRPGETDEQGLRSAIAATIAGELGKPLKPEVVAIVRALPKTRSGKVMRRVIRAAWLGEDPGDLSALDDPGAFAAIRDMRHHPGVG